MEKFNPEYRERPQGVDLRIVSPHGDKHHMVGFNAHTPEEARAYNEAIAHHLGSLKKSIFHQVGGGNDELGYHAWEIWDSEVDEKQLAALIPEIERDANILMTEDDLDALCEKVYNRWDEEKK